MIGMMKKGADIDEETMMGTAPAAAMEGSNQHQTTISDTITGGTTDVVINNDDRKKLASSTKVTTKGETTTTHATTNAADKLLVEHANTTAGTAMVADDRDRDGGTTNFTPYYEEIQPLPLLRQQELDSSFHSSSIRGCPGAHAIAGPGVVDSTTTPMIITTASSISSNNGDDGSTPLEGFLCCDLETSGDPSMNADVSDNIEEAQAVTVAHTEQGGRGKLAAGERRKVTLHLLLGVVCLALSAAVVVTVLVMVSNHSSKNSNATSTTTNLEPPAESESASSESFGSSSSSPNHSSDLYPPFQEDLPAAALKAILQEGPNNDTPEYKANVWMLNDPKLTSYSYHRQRVRFALAVIYYATDGDNWFNNTNWLNYNVSECHWAQSKKPAVVIEEIREHPPVCINDDETEPTFVTLDLNSNNLNGTLPESSFWLTKPKYIDVSHNFLEGLFPAFPSEHTNSIEILIMSNNSFTSQLRVGAGAFFGSLRIAIADNNRLQGNYGAVYQLTPNLEILNFTSNLHFGGISTHLGHLTKLRYLGASNNLLSGTMPTELGLMSSLQVLDYSDNQGLSGTIPSSLESLSTLVEMDVSGTGFTGTFPDLLCEKEEVDLLSIAANCSSMSCC